MVDVVREAADGAVVREAVVHEAKAERSARASLDCFSFRCAPCRSTSDSEDVADGDAAPKFVFDDTGLLAGASPESCTNRSAEHERPFSPDEIPAYASNGSQQWGGSQGSRGSRRTSKPAANLPHLFGSNGSHSSHRLPAADHAKPPLYGSEDSRLSFSRDHASKFLSNATEATNNFLSGGDITILDDYDYYNPITRRKKVLSFTDNRDGIFHHRNRDRTSTKMWNMFQRVNVRRDTGAPVGDTSPTPSEGSSPSDSDSESCGSDSQAEQEPESPTDPSPISGRSPSLRKQKTIFNEDNVIRLIYS